MQRFINENAEFESHALSESQPMKFVTDQGRDVVPLGPPIQNPRRGVQNRLHPIGLPLRDARQQTIAVATQEVTNDETTVLAASKGSDRRTAFSRLSWKKHELWC